MRLRVRPAGPADLAPYFTAFGDPFAYDAYSAGLAKRVPRVWETLIALSAMMAIVFADFGVPFHSSGGEMFTPSHVYWRGIG